MRFGVLVLLVATLAACSEGGTGVSFAPPYNDYVCPDTLPAAGSPCTVAITCLYSAPKNGAGTADASDPNASRVTRYERGSTYAMCPGIAGGGGWQHVSPQEADPDAWPRVPNDADDAADSSDAGDVEDGSPADASETGDSNEAGDADVEDGDTSEVGQDAREVGDTSNANDVADGSSTTDDAPPTDGNIDATETDALGTDTDSGPGGA